jgi:hypothetical protein
MGGDGHCRVKQLKSDRGSHRAWESAQYTHTRITGIEQWTASTFMKEHQRRKINEVVVSNHSIIDPSCRKGGRG